MSSKFHTVVRIAIKTCYSLGVLSLTLALLLSLVNYPVSAEEWNNASLSFHGDCGGNCTLLKALICNDGSGDMDQPTAYEVYYAPSGNPKFGSVVGGGTVPVLPSHQCASLNYDPNGISGNYAFRAFQSEGHPGTPGTIPDLWSGACSISCPVGPSPTPTNTPVTPTATFTPTNTPETPTSTFTPTNTPETPTSTFTPTKTPVTPTPEDPTPTPDNPTSTPTNTPETPTSTPVTSTPTYTPETSTSTPVTSTPTNTPENPTSTPLTPTPQDPTSTPQVSTGTPSNTNTPVVNTLPPPVIVSTPDILIPVTGADFTMKTSSPLAAAQKAAFNLGIGFIGFGMVLQGIRKRYMN